MKWGDPGWVSAPWPQGTMPTVEQWRDWFVSVSPEQQLAITERAFEAQTEAALCFMQDHVHRIAELTEQIESFDEIIRGAARLLAKSTDDMIRAAKEAGRLPD